MQKLVLAFSAALLLAGCQKAEEAAAPQAAPSAKLAALAAPVAATAPTAAPQGVARDVKEENDLYDFAYSYPAQAAAIPALKAWLEADLDKQKADLIKGAKADKQEAAGGAFPYNAHSASSEWKVVTDLPGWLSLSTIVGSYTGGAHPNYAYDALLWDKVAGQRRQATDLFRSKAALAEAIRAPFCNALDAQRGKKRGEKVNRNSGDEFDKCIDPLESTVILGSSNRQTFDRVGVLVPPYSAGPYAEGDYEVTLPVTPAVLAAVKPEYRSAFALKR